MPGRTWHGGVARVTTKGPQIRTVSGTRKTFWESGMRSRLLRWLTENKFSAGPTKGFFTQGGGQQKILTHRHQI